MLNENFYVSIHNLPKDVEKIDIIRFVPESMRLLNENIVFVNDGTAQVIAILKLETPEEMKSVLSKNDRYL